MPELDFLVVVRKDQEQFFEGDWKSARKMDPHRRVKGAHLV